MFGKKKQESVVDTSSIRHIAFIMDGNGRWAKRRGLPREYGHTVGAKVFRRLVEYCGDIGIKCVTVYAFSTENWRRPENEVKAIMKLFREYLDDAVVTMTERDIRIVFLGDKAIFPDDLRQTMERIERDSANNTLRLNIAINYGGRDEIVHAVNKLIAAGEVNITEQMISDNLYTLDAPDPDLIVRSGGEMRLSNFLMWQSAYSELYCVDTLWPDFTERDVDKAIAAYNMRERRYGGV